MHTRFTKIEIDTCGLT